VTAKIVEIASITSLSLPDDTTREEECRSQLCNAPLRQRQHMPSDMEQQTKGNLGGGNRKPRLLQQTSRSRRRSPLWTLACASAGYVLLIAIRSDAAPSPNDACLLPTSTITCLSRTLTTAGRDLTAVGLAITYDTACFSDAGAYGCNFAEQRSCRICTFNADLYSAATQGTASPYGACP
ncbi:unnamed protein product, partial [Phaeothamnion confervicola]